MFTDLKEVEAEPSDRTPTTPTMESHHEADRPLLSWGEFVQAYLDQISLRMKPRSVAYYKNATRHSQRV